VRSRQLAYAHVIEQPIARRVATNTYLTHGKAKASFLKQLGIGKLATGRKLSTDHPDETQIGLDEPLPGQRSLIFEQSQFLLGRIGKAHTRQWCISRQQAGLDDALELDKLGRGQLVFVGNIVVGINHAHTVRQRPQLATPSSPKSVDNLSCPRPT
jgi:hypothetical protein